MTIGQPVAKMLGMADTDPFVKRVDAELRDISRREAKLQEQEDTIKRQRAELRARSAELTKSLNVYRELMGVDTVVTDPVAADSQSGTTPVDSQGTIADVAYRVIATAGGSMSTNDIVAELKRLGKLKGGGESGRGDYGTVYATLLRDGRFVRSDPGVFSLAPPHPSAPALPV